MMHKETTHKAFTQHHFLRSTKNAAGFTILELLIVIAIIGILASVMYARFRGASERARIGNAMQFADTLRASLQADMVAWWTFDDEANPGKDNFFNQLDGQLGSSPGADANDPTWTDKGIINGALQFDGVNDYVALDMHYESGDSLPEFTISAWYKTSFSGGGWGDNWALLDFDRSEWFNVYVRGDNGKLGFSGSDGINDYFDIYADTASNDGKWHHGVIVYDSINNVIKFYLDGKLDGTKTYANMNPISDSTTRYGFIGDGSEASVFNGSRNNAYYDGLIDDVQIYDRALPPIAIQYLYAQGRKTHPLASAER